MSAKPIQEQFGEKVIAAFTDFARQDLKTPSGFEADEFSHITDAPLRRRLSEVFYGARWIYKLGLAVLVENVERAAHVRSQVVDYAAIAEGLLSHCVAHGIKGGHMMGTHYQFRDASHGRKPLAWKPANPEPLINRQSFWWLIEVALDEGMVQQNLRDRLQKLRRDRNSVHLRQKSSLGRTAFLNQSLKAFRTVVDTVDATKRWKATHP